MLGEPLLHFRMLVGRVVVGNQIDGQIPAGFAINFPEKSQPLLMSLLLGDGRHQIAFEIVQRSE